jgi:hypothetical protein
LRLSIWANFIGYQLVWFVIVIYASRGRPGVGLIAALAFMIWQLAASKARVLDLRLMAAALALGVAIDGSLALVGWVAYASPAPALPPGGAPLWIIALWVSFSLTLTRSLAWVMRRPWLGVLFGALGAPLAYSSAARGWSALTFAPPTFRSVAALSAGWAAAMPILSYITRRWPADGAKPVLPLEARAQ